MLKFEKKVELTGGSYIGGKQAEWLQAKINSENPEVIEFGKTITDNDLYKANRAQCRQDAADFEDAAYDLQDKMIAEKAAEE